MDSQLGGNPMLGIPWEKKICETPWRVYDQKLVPLIDEDLQRKLCNVQIKHLIDHDDSPMDLDLLNNNLKLQLTEPDYEKLIPFVKNAIKLKKNLKTNSKYKIFIDFVRTKKGTAHIRKLLLYESPKMENFPSTLYWAEKMGSRVDAKLLKKRFALIASLSISPADKTKLLKFSHRLVGTNSKRSKHTRGVRDVCKICETKGIPDADKCKTNSLVEIFKNCCVVDRFLMEWKQYVEGHFDLDLDVVSRVIFQINGSKLDNIMQFLLNLYLWRAFYHNTPPEIKKCLIFCAGKLDLLMFRSSEEKNSKKLREFLEFAHNELESEDD